MHTPPTLSGIIYYPKNLSLLEPEAGMDFSFFQEPIPETRPPKSEEFQATLLHSKISSVEVPALFSHSPLHPNTSEELKLLEQTVQYLFSDGLLLSCREILYHPYSVLVPLDLLPLASLSHSKLFSDHSPLQLIPFVSLENDSRKAELALIQALVRASRYTDSDHRKIPLQIWVTCSGEKTEPRLGISLSRVQCTEKTQSHWQMNFSNALENSSGKVHFSFVTFPFFKNGIVFRNIEIDPIQKSLLFHTDHKTFQIGHETFLKKLGSPINPQYLEIEGHSQIFDFLNSLQRRFQQEGIAGLKTPELEPLEESSIETQLRLFSNGRMHFCRKIKTNSKEFFVWNLPQIIHFLLPGFHEGLSGIYSIDLIKKNLNSKKKGSKRDRDLKVFKHTGFFHYLLLEVAHFILKNKKLSQTEMFSELEIFFPALYKKLGEFIHEIEKKSGFVDMTPPPSLREVCSSSVLKTIDAFVSELVLRFYSESDHIFLSSGEKKIPGSLFSLLQVIYPLLMKVHTQFKGQCFLKPRFCLFSRPDSLLPIKLLVSEDPDPKDTTDIVSYEFKPWIQTDLLRSLLDLRKDGVLLFYENYLLDEMNFSDFKPSFELIESSKINSSVKNASEENEKIEWFELNPQFFFQGVELSTKQMSMLSQEGLFEFQGKMYLIPDKQVPSIQRLEYFWSKIQSHQEARTLSRNGKTYYVLPKNQTLEMLAFRSMGVHIQGGERWKSICDFYDQLSQKRPLLAPIPSLKATLKPYQNQGVQWILDLYRLGLGGILADDMGLGKTIQTLAFLEHLRLEKEMKRVLILVPTSLTYNWLTESNQFTPELPIQIFQSKNKQEIETALESQPQLAIISTYGLFTEHLDFFEKYQWNIMIFDEAQNLKNISAKRTAASRKISSYFKLCLTGTPLENHLGEFYSLIDLVVSGSLGDLNRFKQQFVSTGNLDPEDLKYLKLKSKPLVLRRSKAQILSELPPKLESTIRLPFEKKQEKIYRDIALSWNEKVKESIFKKGEAQSQILMLTALLRLRQVCSDPNAIPQIKYSEEPPKITVLLEALQEITESGESALVFTQFLSTFHRIQESLQKSKIPCFSIHGKNTRIEREKSLNAFQTSPQGSVLVMTLKTGGVGLNLTKASYVFHIEPWWNPAVENQATDRAYRIGQRKPVQVYRYIMRESIEEKMELLKKRKSAKFDALFGDQEENVSSTHSQNFLLTQSDFEYLLSFGMENAESTK